MTVLSSADRFLRDFVLHGSPALVGGLAFVAGICVGRLLAVWIQRMAARFGEPAGECRCGAGEMSVVERLPLLGSLVARTRCRDCGVRNGWILVVELGTGLLFAAFIFAVARLRSQQIPEGGHIDWIHWRILYHLVLISLLIAATGIDFKLYVIPDSITFAGVACGVIGATLVGNLQLLPLWVDWNQEVPGLHGPYIPEWIRQHWHLHGLAWSMCGMLFGAGVTWLVRALASLMLGREALGFGDVTLMAMIGSFLGWQPVVFVFALAPLCGICVALTVLLLTGKTYVPFGPYLSGATVVVLFAWKWLWTPVRTLFGHPPTLLLLGAITGGALVGLLGLVRLYRAIPARRK